MNIIYHWSNSDDLIPMPEENAKRKKERKKNGNQRLET
jgi:hypothetical protein